EIEEITGATADGEVYRVDFTNEYTPGNVSVPLKVKKILTGNELPEGVDYSLTFTITAASGTPMPTTNPVNMTVNKHKGVRSALCWNEEIARLARAHNNANVCALPARFIPAQDAWRIVKMFLSSEFEGGRHEKRVDKIEIQK
ncbi:MAG: RpiB/LacA/LacB family sugar-phosphate isomerase, partial [Bacteroidales bacterium]|nr:RpiB/LacA/LacB family sugar-phosphate isomerase [Bacteroidales bacterium]